jgi:glycosyltransferase involved in cell wall biosynthesis
LQSALGIPENAFVILQVASLTPEKRHQDSLSALQQIMDDEVSKNFFLVLVGNGPEKYKKKLQQMA